MTAVSPGLETLIFRSKDEIVAHLLERVTTNGSRKIGTEVEMFLLDEDRNPITQANGQRVFKALQAEFTDLGYAVSPIVERMSDGSEKIVSLDVHNLGAINIEAGHQFETASSVSYNCDEIYNKNVVAFDAIKKVAHDLNHRVIFEGYLPHYAERTEGVLRSRGRKWDGFYEKCYDGDDALILRRGQHGTASTQFTLDSGGDKFHEYWSALLILEPVLAIYHNKKTDRLFIIQNEYGSLIPTQVKPIVEAWKATDPKQTIEHIVDRLLKLEVPFLPDPANPGTYKLEPLNLHGRPPLVADLMNSDRLSEKNLNNIGGFFYTGPALRNFRQGLIEVRYMDSIGSPQEVSQIARFITNVVYNDELRGELLKQYAHLNEENVRWLHRAAAMRDKRSALDVRVAGLQVKDIVQNIITNFQPSVQKDQSAPTTLRKPRRLVANPTAPGVSPISLAAAEARASYHDLPNVLVISGYEPPRPQRQHQRPGFGMTKLAV